MRVHLRRARPTPVEQQLRDFEHLWRGDVTVGTTYSFGKHTVTDVPHAKRDLRAAPYMGRWYNMGFSSVPCGCSTDRKKKKDLRSLLSHATIVDRSHSSALFLFALLSFADSGLRQRLLPVVLHSVFRFSLANSLQCETHHD